MNDKFFAELARRLKREGITVGPVEQGRLPVLLEGREVMAVPSGGTIFLMSETADDQPVVNTDDVAAGVSAQVHEYITVMEAAPILNADGLHEGFPLLAEFNGVVLAGQYLGEDRGYQFVTRRRNGDGLARKTVGVASRVVRLASRWRPSPKNRTHRPQMPMGGNAVAYDII